MTVEKIIQFAQKSIYDTTEHIGKWNGFDVYEPGWDDDLPHYTGFPTFILVKGDKIRWTKDWKESRAIMKALYRQ
ncbi:MAG: hypothetical protein NC111_04960 [Bacteroides sp.]|nr:hypothetical protein [Bacteroides sp.]MCM1413677.1 hypothetical protein [Bacteroides sp.]MCM1471856.1 hypothetical protein [Bacteroides sp.]